MKRTLFTEDHEAFRTMIRDFIRHEVAPHFDAWEEEGLPPRDLFRKLGALGVMGFGIDLCASTGTPVVAVGAGTVVEAGWGGAYGYNVVLKMNDGSYTQYGHLSSLNVSVGQRMMPGDQLGRAGSTGNSSGAHLHFEARTSADYGSDINPLAYLRAHGVKI